MDKRSKELAAIAASVAGHCQPCLKHHLGQARLLGIPEKDIRSTVILANIISEKGDERMLEFFESLFQESEIAQAEPGEQGKKEGISRQ